jgi:hypothetical protein
MTLFIDMRKPAVIKRAVRVCLFLALAGRAFGGQDLDLRLGAVGGAKTPGGRDLSNWAPALELRYRCSIPLPQSFSILLGEEFSGLFGQSSPSPLPKVKYPVTAVTFAGIGYNGLGRSQVRGISQVFNNNSEILFPVKKISYLDISPLINSYMMQRYKNGADFFWDLPLWRFHLLTDIFYNDLVFDLRDSTSIKTMRHESDVWANGSLAFDLFNKQLWLKAAARIKDDLNKYNGYDISEYYTGIEGNARVFSNMLAISGNAYARYYESEIMHGKGYGDRLGSLSHLRLIVQIPSGFFIKGDYALETALSMAKFRGEFVIR